MQNGLNQGGSL